jgi:hypothetical protein
MSYKLWSRILFSIVIASLALSYGLAQKVKDTGAKYDVANQVTIKGVIEDIREIPGNFEGTLLVVKTDAGTVQVHVAPASFLKEIDASFAKGDQVEVVGAKTPNAAEEEILAREITVGTNTVTLRDDRGIPVWGCNDGWERARGSPFPRDHHGSQQGLGCASDVPPRGARRSFSTSTQGFRPGLLLGTDRAHTLQRLCALRKLILAA